MPRNLVICCDGTANEFAPNKTNVLKLFYTLVHDPDRQVVFYHPGIGTMEAIGAVTSFGRKLTKVLGLAFGYGLERDIRDAYAFLMNHFEAGDQLYLFGFSRGAYTVRIVASMLHMYGLIHRGNEPLIPYAIRMLMAVNHLGPADPAGAGPRRERDEIFELAQGFREHFCGAPCTPHFVGIWDTVSSVGWFENPVHVPFTDSNPGIAIGRHAVAIDERRAFFRTNLWHPKPDGGGPRDLKQVWFPGVHKDVGGGYAEAESGLSKIALGWMLREAEAAGLLVDAAKVDRMLGRSDPALAKPDPGAKLHNSLKINWWPAEFVPKRHYDWVRKTYARRMNLFRPRTIPEHALIHDSAYERGGAYLAALRARLPATAVRAS